MVSCLWSNRLCNPFRHEGPIAKMVRCHGNKTQREVVIPSEHTTCCCQFIRTLPCGPRRTHHFDQAISAVIVWRVARLFRSLLMCVGEFTLLFDCETDHFVEHPW